MNLPRTPALPWLKRWQYLILKALRPLQRTHLPEILSAVLSVTLIAVGTSLLVSPESFMRSSSYVDTFKIMHPDGWGMGMIVAGSAQILAVIFRAHLGMMAMAFLATLFWTGFAYTITTAVNDGGVPSTAIAYIAMSVLSMIATLIYAGEIALRPSEVKG
jgi:hypothetical protein